MYTYIYIYIYMCVYLAAYSFCMYITIINRKQANASALSQVKSKKFPDIFAMHVEVCRNEYVYLSITVFVWMRKI